MNISFNIFGWRRQQKGDLLPRFLCFFPILIPTQHSFHLLLTILIRFIVNSGVRLFLRLLWNLLRRMFELQVYFQLLYFWKMFVTKMTDKNLFWFFRVCTIHVFAVILQSVFWGKSFIAFFTNVSLRRDMRKLDMICKGFSFHKGFCAKFTFKCFSHFHCYHGSRPKVKMQNEPRRGLNPNKNQSLESRWSADTEPNSKIK